MTVSRSVITRTSGLGVMDSEFSWCTAARGLPA
jgi:hypothetical protein